MQRLKLSPGDPEFSRLAFGTWRLFDDAEASTPAGLLERFKACLDLGITTIDTAEIYGLYRVEELIGAALALDPGVKSKMEIITKAGIYVPCQFHPDRKTAFYNSGAERLVKSAEKSLRFLGVEALDLFLVHRPDWLTHPADTAAGLNRLVREGKIRAAGVSNYTPAQFAALQQYMETPLATNQVQFSPFCMTPVFDGTFDQCQQLGIHPMAWSPTGGGQLFDDADASGQRVRQVMQRLAPKYGDAGADRLCFAWILIHPSRPMAVTGTNRIERLRALAGCDSLVIEPEDWYAIAEAGRGAPIP